MATNDLGNNHEEVSAESDMDDDDQAASRRAISAPSARRRRLPMVLIVLVGIAAIGVTAVLLTSGKSKAKVDSSFTTFVDQKNGFSLSYPRVWTVNVSGDPSVPLKLSFGAEGLDVLQVRVVGIQSLVDTSNVANIKSISDAQLSGQPITILKQQSVPVANVPSYYYLYTLPPVSGVTIVHSQFFIFPPHQLVEILFQTVEQDFSPLAKTFDQVMASFKTNR